MTLLKGSSKGSYNKSIKNELEPMLIMDVPFDNIKASRKFLVRQAYCVHRRSQEGEHGTEQVARPSRTVVTL